MIYRIHRADIITDKRFRISILEYRTKIRELAILRRFLRLKYKAKYVYLTYDTLGKKIKL